MRVLVIAYGYSGNDVSESYSAFKLVQALRRKHQVTVITKDPTTEPGAITVAVPRVLSGSPYYRVLKLDYYMFMWKAYRLARTIVTDYDIVHHISPISLRYPNILCNLPRPFVWGPVGGGIPYPRPMRAVARREPLIYRLRSIDRLRMFVDPLMVNTLSRARAIVLTSNAAAWLLPERWRSKAVVIPEAFEPGETSGQETQPASRYVFSSGRLIPYKGMEFLIRAFAKGCADTGVDLTISGDGPEMKGLKQLAETLGVGGRVHLLGRVPRERNYELMSGSLFCVFPALNEAFGHVNLEAMACGKPVIVTDWGGPSDIVEHGVNGFKIPPAEEALFAEEMGRRMRQLIDDAPLRSSMGVSARARVRERFSWEYVAGLYDRLYENVAGSAVSA